MQPKLLAAAALLCIACTVQAQDCADRTGNNATVVLPDTVTTNLQTGDLIIARYDSLCVGQAVYTEGESVGLTVWGDDTQTTPVDGIPPGSEIQYSAHRPSTGATQDDVTVTYEEGTVTYQPDQIFHVASFSLNGSLPVELIAFDAVVEQNNAYLQWTTASETNNAGFEVQHRTAEDTFSPLAFVEGAGSTLEPQHYHYTASGLSPGPHRFRLRQVDFDGTFAYSPEVEVTIALPERFFVSEAYPNPFNPQTTLTLTARHTEHLTAHVYNARGQLINILFDGRIEAGETKVLRFEAALLASGLYVIRVANRSFAATRQALLVK